LPYKYFANSEEHLSMNERNFTRSGVASEALKRRARFARARAERLLASKQVDKRSSQVTEALKQRARLARLRAERLLKSKKCVDKRARELTAAIGRTVMDRETEAGWERWFDRRFDGRLWPSLESLSKIMGEEVREIEGAIRKDIEALRTELASVRASIARGENGTHS
jgi:hypothetical protein